MAWKFAQLWDESVPLGQAAEAAAETMAEERASRGLARLRRPPPVSALPVLHLRQLLRPPHACSATWAAPRLDPLLTTLWYEQAREGLCAGDYPLALEAQLQFAALGLERRVRVPPTS